jgi:hypothetical protein
MVHMLHIHLYYLLNFQATSKSYIHGTVVLESTAIVISSVFAVIFWVVVRIGVIFRQRRRWPSTSPSSTISAMKFSFSTFGIFSYRHAADFFCMISAANQTAVE